MPHDDIPVAVLDCGAHTIKAGLSTSSVSTPHSIVPNAAIRSKGDKRLYIGHEFVKCRDYASLNYRLSFERGYLTDWDVQKAVWDNLFGPEVLALDFHSTSLLITEPPFNPHSIQEKYDQLAFEEYEFASYLRCPAASLSPYGTVFSPGIPNMPHPECFIIVDTGFSFTHIIPLMQGHILWDGVRRIDVGGKLLTNHLSTLVSFRQWNMLDQTHIVNDVKEKCCYVSSSFSSDLEQSRLDGSTSGIALQYVLPDFSRNRNGYVRGGLKPSDTCEIKTLEGGDSVQMHPSSTNHPSDVFQPGERHRKEKTGTAYEEPTPSDSDQILYMSNEQFTVPEVVFCPRDIGLPQSGLPQTIAHCISSLNPDVQGMFWANIGLIGGNVNFPGFRSRLQQELRALAPVEYDVRIYEANEPIIETYQAAHAFANRQEFPSLAVTREEYNEGGSSACRRKFRKFDWDPIKDRKDHGARAIRRERDRVASQAAEESDAEESEGDAKTKKAPPKRREKPSTTRTKRDLPRGK